MSIGEMVKEGLYYARTCKSLWLFGFFVAITSGGSSGSDGGRGGGGAAGLGGALAPSVTTVATIAFLIAVVVVAAIIMRFLSEGALIEGIVRARQGVAMTVREGFRAGWSHWGVLLRIALIYFAAFVGTLALLALPVVLAARASGWPGAVAAGLPVILVAVPCMITIYLVQAFASQIAVLEHRHAWDAIRKARLFLHGRLIHGLKLIVATLVGTLVIVVVGLAAIAAVVLLLIGLAQVVSPFVVILIGCVVVVPALAVMAAMVGTLRSSIWTIGYVTEQGA
jgi:hypothetical protein